MTQRRLCDSVPDPGQFQIQSEKREETGAPVIRREQSREITIVVVTPHIIVERKVGKYVSHRVQIVAGNP